jgi:hypothetical protein
MHTTPEAAVLSLASLPYRLRGKVPGPTSLPVGRIGLVRYADSRDRKVRRVVGADQVDRREQGHGCRAFI